MRLRLGLGSAAALALLFPAAAPALTITEYAAGITAGAGPTSIAAGSDGNLWFTENNGPRIAKITPAGAVTEYSANIPAGSHPNAITAGPGGDLWYTTSDYGLSGEVTGSRIGRITTAGAVTEYSAGVSQNLYLAGIAAGPDGNVWYVGHDFSPVKMSVVGRVTPAGVVTEFTVGIDQAGTLGDVAPGPDGNLWYTNQNARKIGRITTAGLVTEFSAGTSPGNFPNEIVAGPDGNLWFTAGGGNLIGKITPAGVATEIPAGGGLGPYTNGIAAGPDGNLWFTGSNPDRVARITPGGAITDFTTGLSAAAQPLGIAAGPDGNIWFAERQGNRIGRLKLTVDPPLVQVGDARSVGLTEATLVGTVDPGNEQTSYHFEYGTTTAYGSPTASKDAPGAGEVTSVLTGLAAETTYHYRLVATNAEGGMATSEDRTFTTAAILDRDGDGSLRPADCNDANAAIRPGALDVRGNDVDEDCDGIKLPFLRITSGVARKFVPFRRYTRITRFVVRDVPVGAVAEVSCRGRGCPKKKSRRITGTGAKELRFTSYLAKSKLRKGVVLEVRVTLAGQIGKVVRYRFRPPRLPTSTVLCLTPGQTAPAACPAGS